jgi:hypothetical protein
LEEKEADNEEDKEIETLRKRRRKIMKGDREDETKQRNKETER